MVIQIDNKRPYLEIVRDGETSRWEYDIITLQIEFEALEIDHGLHVDGKINPPTTGFLVDVVDVLRAKGLADCSTDTALRVYSLIKVQWRQLSMSIATQVAELANQQGE